MMYYLPSLTVLLAFACLVTYHYIQDLRGDVKRAEREKMDAWQAAAKLDAELRNLKGLPVPDIYTPGQSREKDTGSAPFVPTGIGPTAIADQELRRQQREEQQRHAEPAFASPATLNPDLARRPTPEQIAAAAREAVGNHGGRK
jgi:hypothetical protein